LRILRWVESWINREQITKLIRTSSRLYSRLYVFFKITMNQTPTGAR
jgi:hypothetical protein